MTTNTHILAQNIDSLSALRKALPQYKDKKYFTLFYEKNIEATKKKLSLAVSFDILVIQVSNHLEELNKITNTLTKRLREWYELYYPELSHQIQDHEGFVKAVLTQKQEDAFKKTKMGAKLSQKDIAAMLNLAKTIQDIYAERNSQENYLEELMKKNAQNLIAITGAALGARLITFAGSLKKLSMMPASTIQLLGAEKSLFRHLRSHARPPKHGILFQHTLLQKAKQKNHGKIARLLADKIFIAAKVDFFKGEFVGNKLYKEIEKKCREMI